ncbi:hypothetical protein, partial [Fusobacterium sp.]|uniref:hypothetical protein n=1 Tax=Fusobacterium sp. TaxID=68766 RepID=UPI0025BA2456
MYFFTQKNYKISYHLQKFFKNIHTCDKINIKIKNIYNKEIVMEKRVRTRVAPSPTGDPHVG